MYKQLAKTASPPQVHISQWPQRAGLSTAPTSGVTLQNPICLLEKVQSEYIRSINNRNLIKSSNLFLRGLAIRRSGILFLFLGGVSETPDARLNHTLSKFHYPIHELHPTNHHSSQERAIYGTSCLLLAFPNPTTRHLSNLRSINLILSSSPLNLALLSSLVGAL